MPEDGSSPAFNNRKSSIQSTRSIDFYKNEEMNRNHKELLIDDFNEYFNEDFNHSIFSVRENLEVFESLRNIMAHNYGTKHFHYFLHSYLQSIILDYVKLSEREKKNQEKNQ